MEMEESILELNIVNNAFGLKNVLLLNLNKIRKLNFPEYDAKKLKDNFSCFSGCGRLLSLKGYNFGISSCDASGMETQAAFE